MKAKQSFKRGDLVQYCSKKGIVSGVVLEFIPPTKYEVILPSLRHVIVDEASIISSSVTSPSMDVFFPGDNLTIKNVSNFKSVKIKSNCFCHYILDSVGDDLVLTIDGIVYGSE